MIGRLKLGVFLLHFLVSIALPQDVWYQTYGRTCWEYAEDVKASSDSTVIVVATTACGDFGAYDALLIEMDITGQIKWRTTYGTTAPDLPQAVIQTADGGYACTGSSGNSYMYESYRDLMLFRTDPGGTELWFQTYGGDGAEGGYALAETPEGGFYCAGYTNSYGAGRYDIWILKTDAMGELIWEQTFGDEEYDRAWDLTVTPDSCLVVLGSYDDPIHGGSLWLMKLDADGNVLWNHLYSGNSYGGGRSIHFTPDGGFIIGGSHSLMDPEVAGSVAWLLKVDDDGSVQWSRDYDVIDSNADACRDVIPTEDGGFLLTGYSVINIPPTDDDLWQVKTDSIGNMEWINRFGGPFDEHGNASVQIPDETYITVGYQEVETWYDRDLLIMRVDSDGLLDWSMTPTQPDNDLGYCIQSLENEGYLILGSTQSYADTLNDIWLIRTDLTGNQLWQRTYDAGDDEKGYWLLETSDGNVVILGSRRDPFSGELDVWLIKVDTSGNQLWERHYMEAGFQECYQMVEAGNGDLIMVGYTSADLEDDADLYLLVADAQGNLIQDPHFGSDGDDRGYAICHADGGGFLLAGQSDSMAPGVPKIWLNKLSADLESEWSGFYGTDGINNVQSVIQAATGGYLLVGSTSPDSTTTSDIYAIRLDDTGSETWSTIWGGSGDDYGQDIIEIEDGSIVVTGHTDEPDDWTERSGVMLLKLDSMGNEIWNTRIGQEYNAGAPDWGQCVEQTQDQGFVVLGNIGSNGQDGNYDVYLVKADSLGQTYWISTHTESSRPNSYQLKIIYPNPFNAQTTITYSVSEQTQLTITIYDLLGRQVWVRDTKPQASGEHQLQWSGTDNAGQDVTSGVYIVQLSTGSWSESRKVVVLR